MTAKTIIPLLFLAAATVSAQTPDAPPAPAAPTPPGMSASDIQRRTMIEKARAAGTAGRAAAAAAAAADPNGGANRLPRRPLTPSGGAATPGGLPGAPGGTAGAAPGVPGNAPSEKVAAAIAPALAAVNASPDDILPAGTLQFEQLDLNYVLKYYAELVNKTILRPASLPAAAITLESQTPITRAEAIRALDSVLALNGIEIIPMDDKFLKAIPMAEANTAGGAVSTNPATMLPNFGSYVTHVVQLKYNKPTEIVPALQIFAKLPNSIFAIDSSGILVLRDNVENVKRMLEMIERIDVMIPSDFESEVIPIKYAIASEIANALNSLSTGGGGTTVGKSSSGSGSSSSSRSSSFGSGGMSNPGGSAFGGSGTPGGSSFGSSYGRQGTTTGTTPGGASGGGSSFTDRLQNIIRKASVTGDIQVLGQTKIVADERTNSLLVYASKEDMKTIKDIIKKLDVVLAQVLIESVIIEISLGPNNKQFGIAYLQHPKSVGNWTGVGAVGRPFYSPSDFISPSSGTNAAGNLIGGFNYLMQFNQDLDVTLQAVESDSRAKILQRPRIQTSHNEKAQLFVGESRPYPNGSYYGGGSFGSYASIQQLQIGVELDVTPLINVEGLVVMDIHQKIDSFQGNVVIQGVGEVPITSSKEAQAKVAVRNHETIMLGGLIETDKSKSASGVPFLMDIPLLGYLFKSGNTSEQRKELVVLIRPTVLETPQIAADVAELETQKMPGVARARLEMKREETKAAADAHQAARRELKEIQELRKYDTEEMKEYRAKIDAQEPARPLPGAPGPSDMKPPVNSDAKAPPVNTDTKGPPINTDAKRPPVNTDTKAPPVNTDSKVPPVNTDTSMPPVNSVAPPPPVNIAPPTTPPANGNEEEVP